MGKRREERERKISQVLELQEEEKNRSEIADALEYTGGSKLGSLDTFMRRWGYQLVEGKYIDVKDEAYEGIENKSVTTSDSCSFLDELDSISNYLEDKTKDISPVKSEDAPIVEIKLDEDEVMEIVKADSEYKEMLEYFKTMKENAAADKCISSGDTKIIIDLDTEEEFRTSIRVNKKVYEDFQKFAKINSQYKVKDLISVAFKEFLEKHS